MFVILQVQKWLNTVNSDDKDSDNSSGEISNPDSGRGTDEPDTSHRVMGIMDKGEGQNNIN